MITRIGAQPIVAQASPNAAQHTYVVVQGKTQSLPITCTNDLTLKGNMNVIHWEGTGKTAEVYRASGGAFGYIGQSDEGRLIDDNIEADLTKPPPGGAPPQSD
jgi:hypothetical protein